MCNWRPVSFGLVAITQFGPVLGLLTAWILMRRPVRALLPDPEPSSCWRRRLVVAAVVMTGYSALTLALARQIGVLPDGLVITGGRTLMLPATLQLLGALGEEVG